MIDNSTFEKMRKGARNGKPERSKSNTRQSKHARDKREEKAA